MSFLHSRAERVATHIREGIFKREWTDPLPSTREWARKLGVSPPTLCAALAVLRKEGLVCIEERQGVRLGRGTKRSTRAPSVRTVRVFYYGLDYHESLPGFLLWVGPLSAALQKHGIQLSIEKCSDERLRQLCTGRRTRPGHSHELLLPVSVSEKYQRMLAASRRPALNLGYPFEGAPLPFVACDYVSPIRHAVHRILRQEFNHLTFLLGKGHGPGIDRLLDAFVSACREWPHQPVHAEPLLVPLDLDEERAAMRRFADRIKLRQGILILPPLSVGLLMTTLLSRGVTMPGKVQVMVVGSHPDSVCFDPQPMHYPFPTDAFVKAITNAAVHFFETGSVPPVRKLVPMEVVTT